METGHLLSCFCELAKIGEAAAVETAGLPDDGLLPNMEDMPGLALAEL